MVVVVVVAQRCDELGHSVRERERVSLVDVWRKRQSNNKPTSLWRELTRSKMSKSTCHSLDG